MQRHSTKNQGGGSNDAKYTRNKTASSQRFGLACWAKSRYSFPSRTRSRSARNERCRIAYQLHVPQSGVTNVNFDARRHGTNRWHDHGVSYRTGSSKKKRTTSTLETHLLVIPPTVMPWLPTSNRRWFFYYKKKAQVCRRQTCAYAVNVRSAPQTPEEGPPESPKKPENLWITR